MPYKLNFNMKLTEKNPLQSLKGIAFGELEGNGEWLFNQKDSIVYVQYNWNVITTKKWMNTFSFLLKLLFRINHNIVMGWAANALQKNWEQICCRKLINKIYFN